MGFTSGKRVLSVHAMLARGMLRGVLVEVTSAIAPSAFWSPSLPDFWVASDVESGG